MNRGHPGGGTEQDTQIVPPELEHQYPEPGMFGPMPTYGFFIRHVDGITLDNIEMEYTNKDMRPPFWLHDVKNAEFNHIKAEKEDGVPVFMLKEVEKFRTHEVRGMEDTYKEKVEDGKP